MATTTLDRIWGAVTDLHNALRAIERELEEFEFGKPEPDAKVCECRHPRNWHKSLTRHHQCLSPDCPCRKFEPAGGVA